MRSVISLVGRPNVGKSTLFNALTGTRQALVYDMPGTTRDRQYGEAMIEERKVIVVDTGGLTTQKEGVETLMQDQVDQAIMESQLVLFIVDAKAGLLAEDYRILKALRKYSTPMILVVNKVDAVRESVLLDFYELGLGEPLGISAAHRQGMNDLRNKILELLPSEETDSLDSSDAVSNKVAIVGRPNVGKSTLVNRLLGEERVVVYDMPGTTRDSIYIPFERLGKQYTLIDTAGVRRRSKVEEVLEKFSIVKTLNAIEDAQVVVILIDATENIVEQDLHLIGFALDAGKGIVIAVNKWDHLPEDQKARMKQELDRRLTFIESFVDVHFISAKYGTGVGTLYPSIDLAYESGRRDLSTADINRVLEAAVRDHEPPMVGGRRIKIRFGHVGGHQPLQIVLHGNQLERIPGSYKRYLIQVFRKAFKLRGVPIRLTCKSSVNPFVTAGKPKRTRQDSE